MFNFLKILFMKKKMFFFMAIFAFVCALVCGSLSSCNVTRVVTNESQYYQRGDTAVMITTKTVESYDAVKKSSKF